MTLQDFIQAGKTTAQDVGINSNGSVFGALLFASASGSYLASLDIVNVGLNSFTQTAQDLGSLSIVAESMGIRSSLPESTSLGSLTVATQDGGLTITAGTTFTSVANIQYGATSEAVSFTEGYSTTTSYSYVNKFSQVTTGASTLIVCQFQHYLGIGMQVSIDSVNYTVNAIPTSFSFEVSTSVSITVNSEWFVNLATVSVQSIQAGYSTNLTIGNELTIGITNTAISSAYTNFQGITGGAGAESLEQYRQYCLAVAQYGRGEFNFSQIYATVLSIQGNTRAWITPSSPSTPAPSVSATTTIGQGQTQIYFVRDLDATEQIFPTQTATVTQKTISAVNNLKPMNCSSKDLYIGAPVKVDFDIVIGIPSAIEISPALSEKIQGLLQDMLFVNANVGASFSVVTIINTLLSVINPDTNENIANIEIVSVNGITAITQDTLIPISTGELLYFNSLQLVSV